ncbi:MAG: hypothetical protein NT169_21665 [Chloroflexi bacterium]|nr:hypothetical protein [Chloroflexota bacterium]
MPDLIPSSAAKPSGRFVAAHLFQTLVTFLVIGGVLFISAR